jgi:hypothetical protein
MAVEHPDRSKRARSLPLGVQSLLAGGILLLILIVARQFTVVPAKDEDKAVDAIRMGGGGVSYRQPADEIKTPFGTYRRSWFTPILGANYFKSVLGVRIWPIQADVVSQPFGKPAQASAILPHFDQLRSCEEVNLRGTTVTDADLKHLTRVPRLRVMDLGSTPITDAGVKELTAARDLEVLNLEHTRVGDDVEPILSAMPKLREVNLEGTFVSDGAVQRLKKEKPEVAVTWAKAPSEADRAAAAEFDAGQLVAMRGIAVRAMRCASGTTGYVAAVQWSAFWPRESRPPPTASVKARAAALGQLLRLPNLVRLNLYGGSLSAADLDDLAQLKMLRELCLFDGCNFISPPGTAEHFVHLTSLRKLVLVRVAVANRELELIGSLPQLEVLALHWPEPYYRSTDDFWMRHELVAVNDDSLECLRRMPRLRSLALRGAKVTDAGLVYVRTLASLESLDLSGTKVTPAGLRRLQGMLRLRQLVILGIPIDAQQEAELRRDLPQAAIRTGPLDPVEPRRPPRGPAGERPLAELLRDEDPVP